MNKKLIIAFVSSLIISTAFSQGKFKFDSESHDFGIVTEGEMATHEFNFKNIGDQPIVLTDVKASCGCTTPVWTKTPIMPGQQGSIKVVYNSTGRMGVFNKNITITSNTSETAKIVIIKGIVEQAPIQPPTASEIASSPKLTLLKQTHNFGKILIHKGSTYKFAVKNDGKNPLIIEKLESTCGCTTYTIDKTSIPVGETGTLTLTYTPRETGTITENVYIYSNDVVNKKKKLVLTSTVVESLSNTNMMQQERAVGF